MRPSENFHNLEVTQKGAELPNMHHLISFNSASDDRHSNTKGESVNLVKSGVLPDVLLQDDKHPKKKDAPHSKDEPQTKDGHHGTAHGGGHGPNLKNVHISKTQGEIVKGVVKTAVPGGGLIVAGAPYAVDGIKKLIDKHKQHADKNHADKSHTDKSHQSKSHADDPLYKLKHEGKNGLIHRALKKFHL